MQDIEEYLRILGMQKYVEELIDVLRHSLDVDSTQMNISISWSSS